MSGTDRRKPMEGLAARKVAVTVLTRVIDDHRNLDALIDHGHGLDVFLALDQRDRGLVRAITTTALRKRRVIEEALNKVMDRKPPQKARHLIHSLHVAAAQILFMEVPDSAAANLAVSMIAAEKRSERFKNLANAVLRRMVREKGTILEKTQLLSNLPDWFSKRLRQDFGKENARAISQMVSLEPVLDISVKSEPQKWAEKLDGVLMPTGTIRLAAKTSVTELPGFDDGEWWIQDAASSLPVKLMGDLNGKKVLELCAAPGGKTAQLVAAGAEVTAVELSKPRLGRLRENLTRLKMKAELVQADLLEWESDENFDYVLLDAPCSSTGTIRRHPDVLWTKQAQDVTELAKLQRQMLEKASNFVKPNGKLMFSNCSLFKEEGENMISKLGEGVSLVSQPFQNDEFPELAQSINGRGSLRALPHHFPSKQTNLGGMDGFFANRFLKTA